MIYLSEKVILMMVSYIDRIKTHDEVCYIFNDLYPGRNLIIRSTGSKILQSLNATGMVKKDKKQ